MTINEAELKATELAKEYLDRGFHFNAYTMSGIGGGEQLRLDLMKNDSFIRIYIGLKNGSYNVHVMGKLIEEEKEIWNTIWTTDLFEISLYE